MSSQEQAIHRLIFLLKVTSWYKVFWRLYDFLIFFTKQSGKIIKTAGSVSNHAIARTGSFAEARSFIDLKICGTSVTVVLILEPIKLQKTTKPSHKFRAFKMF